MTDVSRLERLEEAVHHFDETERQVAVHGRHNLLHIATQELYRRLQTQYFDLTFAKQNAWYRKKSAHLPLYSFDFELKFYAPVDTKQVILETFFPANLLA